MMRSLRGGVLSTGFTFACTLTSAHAEVRLLDKASLTQALERQPQCCVVDGRSAQRRDAQPLAESLPYRPGMKVAATATVVVVADSDADALRIANAIGKSHPGKPIVALEGGFAAWDAIQTEQQRGQPPRSGLRFVIPRNTCESGTPLQTLIRKQP